MSFTCKDIPDERILAYAREWHEAPIEQKPEGAFNRLVAEGFPEKVVAAKIDRLVRRGVLEYGSSIRYPWPVLKQ